MSKEKKNKIIQIVSAIIVVAIFIGLTIYLFPIIKNLATEEGQIAFKEKIDSSGIYGFLILFGLQIAQILLVILPGEPLEILAGMCYGPVGGTLFVLFSNLVTTVIIYFLVVKFGKKLLYLFFGKDKIEKIENSKVFKNTKTIEKILIVLFLITGTPKDLLTYIGGLLPIKPVKFILIATFCRFPSVISSTIAGSHISNGNIMMMIIVYVVTFALTAIGMFIFDKVDKDKVTKEAIEIIK